MANKKYRRKLNDIVDSDYLNKNQQVDDLIQVFKEWMWDITITPLRVGDATEQDEIIEDGIQEALVRQTIQLQLLEETRIKK